MLENSVTRRRLLIGTGAVATGTVTGVSLLSNNAEATVDGEFRIPDAKTTLPDQSLTDIRLTCTANWSFEANAPITQVETELYVGSGEQTADLIARQVKENVTKESLTGTAKLNGSLMSSADFDVSDFTPTSGELSTSVTAILRFYCIRESNVVAEAEHIETFTVTTVDEELQVDTSLGGTGNVTFVKDSL